MTLKDIKNLFKGRNIRVTLQKIKIYEYLLNNRTHPDAETIFKELSKEMVAISRATVYNVLKELTEKHLILALPVGQKFHFDAYLEHVHLICEKCGGIYDLYSIPKQKISTKNVDGHIVYDKCEVYKGICKNCCLKEKENSLHKKTFS